MGAKRRRKRATNPITEILKPLNGPLIGGILLIVIAAQLDAATWMILLLGLVIAWATWIGLKTRRIGAAEAAFWDIYDRHASELARARLQSVRRDRYGVLIVEGWNRELEYFINKVMAPGLSEHSEGVVIKVLATQLPVLEAKVIEAAEQLGLEPMFSEAMSPVEYEVFCAALLRKAGWDARTTKGSGDQGADVIAQRNGRRLVVQCKMYKGAVGNSAVQEVVAARAHERADIAAVVASSKFTRAAQQLAQTNGALLLHHSDLPTLDA